MPPIQPFDAKLRTLILIMIRTIGIGGYFVTMIEDAEMALRPSQIFGTLPF